MKKKLEDRVTEDGSIEVFLKSCMKQVLSGQEGMWHFGSGRNYCFMSNAYCPLQYDDGQNDSLYACKGPEGSYRGGKKK